MTKVTCDNCAGKKKSNGIGCMKITCPKCKGTGSLELKSESDKAVDEKVEKKKETPANKTKDSFRKIAAGEK